MIWFAGICLVIAVLLIVLMPLVRAASAPSVNHALRERKLKVADQLAALSQLKADGDIGEEEYLAQQKALETDALDMLAEEKASANFPQNESPDRRRLRFALAAFGFLLAANLTVGLYYLLGAAGGTDPIVRQASAPGSSMPQAQNGSASGDPMEMVGRLEARLRDNPEDAPGQAMLGRSYMVLERYDDSVKAYAKAVKLNPHEMNYRIGLGVSTLRSGKLSEAEQIFAEVLRLENNNPDGLWFTGMLKVHGGDIDGAKASFKRLLDVTPPEHKEEMKSQIDEVLQALAHSDGLPRAQ
jgi:cytochrome c-type biogenesis protein CcmH